MIVDSAFNNTFQFDDETWRNIPTGLNPIQRFGMLTTDVDAINAMVGSLYISDDVIARPFRPRTTPTGRTYASSRFSNGKRFGVLYSSTDELTTVYETVFHWITSERQVRRNVITEIIQHRSLFKLHASTEVTNLLGMELRHPDLLHPTNYSFAQSVGDQLYDQNVTTFMVRSARCNGININFFNRSPINRVSFLSTIRYRWITNQTAVFVEDLSGNLIRTLPAP